MTAFERAYTALTEGNFEHARDIFVELHKDENTEMQVRADSVYMLGWICYKEIRAINYHQADFWFRKAAEFNQEQAQFYLGEMSELGVPGLKANPSHAFFWYSLAVLNLNETLQGLGNEIWKSIVRDAKHRTETALSDEQKAEMEKQIDIWVASHP